MSPVAHGKFIDDETVEWGKIPSGGRLVVFGAGYIGGELARQGAARGLKVTALTRNPATARNLDANGVHAVIAELSEDTWHDQIDSGADYVVNCVSAGGGGLAGYQRSYVEGMKSILAWANRGQTNGTLVYTSSTSVYPQGNGATVQEADMVAAAPNITRGSHGSQDAASLLLEAEALALEVGTEDSFPSRYVLRLAGIYGPKRHHLLDQLREGVREMGGQADTHLNLIHRNDVLSAIWAALASSGTSCRAVYNVCDDGAASRADVVGWLAGKLGVPIPSFTGMVTRGRQTAGLDRVISNAKIKAELGWKPRYPTYREGYDAILGGQNEPCAGC